LASLGHPCKFQRLSRLGSVTARHSSSGRLPNFAALNRGRHLYLAGRPLRCALAHILVVPILYCPFSFYSAPQCSHCKRCTSYGNSVRLSVRLSHAGIVSKRRHVARCSLHYQIAKCVWFCRNQKIFPRDDLVPLKSWLEVTYPLLIAANLDTFCLVVPQQSELAKNVQLWRTGSRIRAFQRAINEGSTPPLTSSKWGSNT